MHGVEKTTVSCKYQWGIYILAILLMTFYEILIIILYFRRSPYMLELQQQQINELEKRQVTFINILCYASASSKQTTK